jgi:carbonic anhydrase
MQKLIEGLHKFQSEVFHSHQELFDSLSKGQKPETLFITCSDSRISPNLITQTKPGDLFILRNAGNLVPTYGPASSHGGEAGTIEFALAGLGVKHIVVCGHTLCGAVKGLLNPVILDKMPAVKSWLEHAESTKRVMEENYSHLKGDALLTAAIEENVLSQLENLRTHPAVRSRIGRGELSLYGWVYKMETGHVFQYDNETGQFSPMNGEALPVGAFTDARIAVI